MNGDSNGITTRVKHCWSYFCGYNHGVKKNHWVFCHCRLFQHANWNTTIHNLFICMFVGSMLPNTPGCWHMGPPMAPMAPMPWTAMDAMGRPSHLDVKDFPAGMKPVRTERSSDEIPPVVVG